MIKYPKGALKTTAEIAALLAEGVVPYLIEQDGSIRRITFKSIDKIIDTHRGNFTENTRKYLNYEEPNAAGHFFLWALGLDDEKAPEVFRTNFQPTEFVFSNYWDAWAHVNKLRAKAATG